MSARHVFFLFTALALSRPVACMADTETVTATNTVWREDFDSLDAWEPLTFPKIDRGALGPTLDN